MPNLSPVCRNAIAVHGAGGGGWEWAIWQRVFGAAGWQLQAPDLQPVAAGLAATQLADYSAQVQSWVEAATREPPHSPPLLIGASLGGLLALKAATQMSLAGLVLINPIPPAAVGLIDPKPAYPPIVAWGSARSLDSTRRAMPDADDAACLHAFLRWRDESGAVLNAALAGIEIAPPRCPMLVLASERDRDIPPATSIALAHGLQADLIRLPQTSHVGPLLGRSAARCAARVLSWVQSIADGSAGAAESELARGLG